MAEFIVSVSFLLLPLFLIIPVIGKYADIKHTSIQAARFEAWEYTVYHDTNGGNSSGFNAVPLPVKSQAEVHIDRDEYFMESDEKSNLWRYHDGSSINGGTTSNLSGSLATSDGVLGAVRAVGGAANDALNNEFSDDIGHHDFYNGIKGFVKDAFNYLGDVLGQDPSSPGGRFDVVRFNGRYTTDLATAVNHSPFYSTILGDRRPLLLGQGDLTMSARAAVISNNWNAGGPEHTDSQVRGMVPTAGLDVVLGGMQNVVSAILLTPEFSEDSLQFGKVEEDIIHPIKLKDGNNKPIVPEGEDGHKCPKGYCQLEYY